MKEVLISHIKHTRQYRSYSVGELIVEKVFNHGMGSIPIMRFYPKEREVCINKCFWNRADERHLSEILSDLKGQWNIIECKYGYPDWYSHNFGKAYAIDKQTN